MSAIQIQRKSLYCVTVTENKGGGWLNGKHDFHDTMTEYTVADSERQAKRLAIHSLKNAGLLLDLKKIIDVHAVIEQSSVVLEV